MIDDFSNIVEEDALEINLDQINKDSSEEAKKALDIVSRLYHDRKFLNEHPHIAARINLELDTIRGLLKMRKASEEAHDSIIMSLSSNKDNASMYRSLSEVQKTSIAISNKIHDTIDRLNTVCKDAQYMNDVPRDDDEESDEESEEISNTHRGSKSFIEQMMD